MDRIATRLSTCFETVFPDLAAKDIPAATQRSVAAWDSTAAIMLVNVIEDEFGIQMDFDRLGELDSFESICQYLKEQQTAGAASDGSSA
ncbi:MAG TPA: acyl carrier protein [Bryobacteraceae bacterium]|nr:acyl carrier protein [Bryobacteraceae bacterium]